MLRTMLIGCGNMGHVLAGGLERLTSRFSVAATADPDIKLAERLAERFPGARAVADYREALGDVDALVVAAPHHLHHQIGMDCLRAGKHVFMEKPLANSERECLDLIKASEDEGLVLMAGYVMRFHPLVARMRELIQEKAYGDAFHVSIWTEQHTERAAGHWMLKARTLGGGQLFSHGCHYVDLLLWFLGRPVRGVHFGTNFGTPWMEREGTSNVCIEFESRALGYHFGTWGARGTRLGYAIHAHCTEGMLEAQIHGGKLIFHKERREETLMEAPSGKPIEAELAHFADCVEQGRKPLTDARASLQTLRLIWRLYEAEERGVVADLRGCGLDEGM
jgi:predicted dehydrogenase